MTTSRQGLNFVQGLELIAVVILLALFSSMRSFAAPAALSSAKETICETLTLGLVQAKRIMTDWSKVDLNRIFLAMKKKGIPLTVSAIRVQYRAEAEAILEEMLGYKIGANTFVVGVKRKFGNSWSQALSERGIDPTQYDHFKVYHVTGSRYVDWTRVDFKAILQLFQKNGIPLNISAITETHRERAEAVLEEYFGKPVPAANFHSATARRFGSYDECLKSNGFNPTEHRIYQKGELTREKVIEIFGRLHAIGISLNSSAFPKLRSNPKVVAIIEEIVGAPVSTMTIRTFVLKEFGGWVPALKAAKLPVNKIIFFQQIDWTPDLVLKALKLLKEDFENLNLYSLVWSRAEIENLLYSKLGFVITLETLARKANLFFGSWSGALAKAGVSLKEIWLNGTTVPWSKELMRDLLTYLAKNRVNLEVSKLVQNGQRIRFLTYHRYQIAISPKAILTGALNLYGRWQAAMDDAGIAYNPQKRMRRRTSDIPIIPHVIEWERQADGTSRRVMLIGEPPKTPEELALINEAQVEVARSLSLLSDQDRQIGRLLLEYLDEAEDLEDQGAVVHFLEVRLGISVSWAVVEATINKMAGSVQ